jgi:hypothetical protein
MTAGRTSKDPVSLGHDISNRMGGRVWSGCAIDKGNEREGRADRA